MCENVQTECVKCAWLLHAYTRKHAICTCIVFHLGGLFSELFLFLFLLHIGKNYFFFYNSLYLSFAVFFSSRWSCWWQCWLQLRGQHNWYEELGRLSARRARIREVTTTVLLLLCESLSHNSQNFFLPLSFSKSCMLWEDTNTKSPCSHKVSPQKKSYINCVLRHWHALHDQTHMYTCTYFCSHTSIPTRTDVSMHINLSLPLFLSLSLSLSLSLPQVPPTEEHTCQHVA